MVDILTPRVPNERDNLQRSIDRHRDIVVWKLAGVSDEDLSRPMTPSGSNLIGLVKHLAAVEYGWFCETFGREADLLPSIVADEEADMALSPGETVAEVFAFYDRARNAANEAIAATELDATGTSWAGTTVNMRWVLVHMIEETARHAGHIDIMRELVDGVTGDRPD